MDANSIRPLVARSIDSTLVHKLVSRHAQVRSLTKKTSCCPLTAATKTSDSGEWRQVRFGVPECFGSGDAIGLGEEGGQGGAQHLLERAVGPSEVHGFACASSRIWASGQVWNEANRGAYRPRLWIVYVSEKSIRA